MEKIRIQFTLFSAFYSPLISAMSGGFLKSEGLEPEWSVSPPGVSALAALKDGSAHVVQSALSQGFATLDQGKEPEALHFAQINEMDGFFLTARKPDPAYTASKGGLEALARSLAIEFGADNLTVNAIAPGWFVTEPNRALAEDPEVQAFVDTRIPLKRWGRPEELAPAALFLASPAASFVNGITLTVDGGMSAQM